MLNQLMKKKSNVPNTTKGTKYFEPNVDIYETSDYLKLIYDIPGSKKDKVDIKIDNDVLTMTAGVENYLPKGSETIRNEYLIGNYSRSFTLTDEVDKNKIEAKYENGVLELTLPKLDEVKPKHIEVK